jgi:hypothetical protein
LNEELNEEMFMATLAGIFLGNRAQQHGLAVHMKRHSRALLNYFPGNL